MIALMKRCPESRDIKWILSNLRQQQSYTQKGPTSLAIDVMITCTFAARLLLLNKNATCAESMLMVQWHQSTLYLLHFSTSCLTKFLSICLLEDSDKWTSAFATTVCSSPSSKSLKALIKAISSRMSICYTVSTECNYAKHTCNNVFTFTLESNHVSLHDTCFTGIFQGSFLPTICQYRLEGSYSYPN